MIFIHIIKLTLTIYQVYQLVIYWPALNKQGENISHMQNAYSNSFVYGLTFLVLELAYIRDS